MTSPDFMYPQPTDDELAAQQPYTPALGGPGIVPGTGPTAGVGHTLTSPDNAADSRPPVADAKGPRLGKAALVIAIVAAVLSLIASIILGMTVGPMEAEYGYYFTDTPSWYGNLAVALFGLQALCAALGITGLIMGIVSAATNRGKTQGTVAIAIAVLAPFLSFALFMVLSFALA